MAMKYKLKKSVTMGDLTNTVTVSELKITHIAFNFEDIHTKDGGAIVSVVLKAPENVYQHNVYFHDKHGLALAKRLVKLFGKELLNKGVNIGQLPEGEIVEEDDAFADQADSSSIDTTQ